MSEGKPPVLDLPPAEMRELAYAVSLLENPGLAARLSNVLGVPITNTLNMLPAKVQGIVHLSVKNALVNALQAAVYSLGKKPPRKHSERFHKIAVGASGGIGGVFGFAALAIELPISTTVMLRSIADIARSEGHSLQDMNTRLDCLEVFALGVPKEGDGMEGKYWAVRAALSRAVGEAAAYLTQKGLADGSAPALAKLVSAIGSRFGVVVGEEVAAKAIPIVGAASGAIINVLFLDHFQDMARGHFIVRRLEKSHGTEAVKSAYLKLRDANAKK